MYHSILAALFLSALPSVYSNELADECRKFVDGIDRQAAALRVDYDITYAGALREIGTALDERTEVRFGDKSFLMPFVGQEQLVVDFRMGSAYAKHKSGRAGALYFPSTKRDDVVEYLIGRPIAGANPFEEPVLHEWLVYKGFEYTTKDLDCSASGKAIAKTMAFLVAKALTSGEGSTVYRLEEFEIGLIQVRWNLATIMILDGDKAFYLSFEATDDSLIQAWIGH